MTNVQKQASHEINDNRNLLLFPYGKVKAGSEIIIYGLGKVGQLFLHEIKATDFCHVLAMTGKDWRGFELLSAQVCVMNPECIPTVQFDYIVIASDKDAIRREIYDYLVNELDVPREKIVSDISVYPSFYMAKAYLSDRQRERGFSYKTNEERVSVAFLVGGGMGDVIIQKKIICYICDLLKDNFSIDVYGPIEFTESILSDCVGINNYFPPGIYESQCENYDLSINAMYTMSLDSIKYEKIGNRNIKLIQVLKHLEKQLFDYNLVARWNYESNSIHFLRCKYLNRNAYNAYSENGGIEINDTKVNIPLDKDYLGKYDELDLGNAYITVHYGWGGATNGIGHAKLWPLRNFNILAKMLRGKYQGLQIVQLGGENAPKIEDVNKYLLGENLELVKYVLRGSLLHIDTDSGLVHLATQLGTKCAVLFGPTPVWYFGYEQNMNIVSDNCNSCYFLERNFTRCLRRLEQPECMASITPDRVMNAIEGYLAELSFNGK